SAKDVVAIQELAGFLNKDREGLEVRGEGEVALSRRLNFLIGALENDDAPGRLLQTLRESLIEPLDIGIADLRELLRAEEVSFEDLPKGVVRRFVGANGEMRIVVTPAYPLDDDAARRRFYHDVRDIAPHVTGMGPETLESGSLIAYSLRDALVAALIVMVLLLTALWQRLGDTACVLFPLLLGGLLTCSTMVFTGMAFNFANIIGIPLMLGIGIDTGIHLVHRARVEGAHGEALLHTGTTRAVIYSNLTTMASFGSLSVATHLGMASLGKTLFLSILFILIANLMVLPALLDGGIRREPYSE
ncbi:MAG: MMPL family transporter, partial [Deltaproteobacteria bacterium]|nr:MMPL family transporter [Deltaproteobacteria bacterium]